MNLGPHVRRRCLETAVGPPKSAVRFVRAVGPTFRLARLMAIATTVAACVPAFAQESPAWPDTYVARLQVLALIQTLNAEALASRSSTLLLEKWCRDHQLADEPKIVADVARGVGKIPTAEQRQRLQVTPQDEVKYRRVQLRCGNRILSEAENWYVPDRLTADMNRLLATTGTPFGKLCSLWSRIDRHSLSNSCGRRSRMAGSAVQSSRPLAPLGFFQFPMRCSSTGQFCTLGSTSRSRR
jgi:hypothetical protein